MVVFDNLAHILRAILLSEETESYKDWKVLGEEGEGWLIVGWVTENVLDSKRPETWVGAYLPKSNDLKVLYKFKRLINIIQASVDANFELLSYVEKVLSDEKEVYKHFIVRVQNDVERINEETEPFSLGVENTRQIMTNFLISAKQGLRLLVLVHTENITIHRLEVETTISAARSEAVTKGFMWAQWDCETQTLYFIHFRKSSLVVDEEDGVEKQEMAPTLSGFQFHSDLPHETVLNIPLNLPSLPRSPEASSFLYEDDCIPLRVHDCSLDLLVVSNKSGLVCICHHYLYQPVKPPSTDHNSPVDDKTTVHFAYSITLLHHGCVVHCALPGVPWALAKTLRPGFTLLGSQYLMIHGPGVFTHLLDVGLAHEPFCHILLTEELQAIPKSSARLVHLSGDFTDRSLDDRPSSSLVPSVMIDLLTLDLLEVEVTFDDLLAGFNKILSDSNRLAILHYFLVHVGDLDLVEELLGVLCSKPGHINTTLFLQEILVGGAYSITQKNVSSDAANLVSLLPLSCIHSSGKSEVKVNQATVSISQEILWNTAMMLLSPQQRLVPYRSDIWTKLWDHLARLTETERFKHSQVAEKLMVSLVCYQPEALSRCTTPMSPAAGFLPTCSFIDLASVNQVGGSRKGSGLELPFFETDNCTASKQEHIISVVEASKKSGAAAEDIYTPTVYWWPLMQFMVPSTDMDESIDNTQQTELQDPEHETNLRELNMYLLKNCLRESPIHVHAVATRYVTAQLEISRQLCCLLNRLAEVSEISRTDKGIPLIRHLDDHRARTLFMFFQRFYHASETLAYPLPQGFMSFFCYLGYTVLPFNVFLQYLHSNVFQLQVDVMKEILKEPEDTKQDVKKKLRLLQALPRSRAKRLLNTWSHPSSLMLRAREHALNILSGVQGPGPRVHPSSRRCHSTTRGLAAFPSGDRVSPLDTFLDLLTAKASLTDLDFNLLIEATISSTEEFFQ